MEKAGNKLRQHNYKKKYEVQRDPLDGNVYLHVDPAELANMTPEEIKKVSSEFKQQVKEEMAPGEYQRLAADAKDEDKN